MPKQIDFAAIRARAHARTVCRVANLRDEMRARVCEEVAKMTAIKKGDRFPLANVFQNRGKEAVATGEFRAPKKGEYFLSGAIIKAYQATTDKMSAKYHIASLANKGELSLTADEIARVLEQRGFSDIIAQGDTEAVTEARDEIRQHYGELRLKHSGGFEGAMRQARADWLTKILTRPGQFRGRSPCGFPSANRRFGLAG